MTTTTLRIREIGIIAATRGMAGAGAALLLADRLPLKKRKALGWKLLLVGVLSTIPLVIDVVNHTRAAPSDKE